MTGRMTFMGKRMRTSFFAKLPQKKAVRDVMIAHGKFGMIDSAHSIPSPNSN